MNYDRIQIVLVCPIKGTKIHWKSGPFWCGAGKIQDENGISVVPENKKCSQNDEAMSKRHRNQTEEALNGQRWNNLSNKIIIVLDYIP